MAVDEIEEQMNIDLSRLQRQTLERYLFHCILVGEAEVAAEVRAAMSAQDEVDHRELAA